MLCFLTIIFSQHINPSIDTSSFTMLPRLSRQLLCLAVAFVPTHSCSKIPQLSE